MSGTQKRHCTRCGLRFAIADLPPDSRGECPSCGYASARDKADPQRTPPEDTPLSDVRWAVPPLTLGGILFGPVGALMALGGLLGLATTNAVVDVLRSGFFFLGGLLLLVIVWPCHKQAVPRESDKP